MRIFVIINARMPTEKAHGIQVMNLCQGFAKVGNETTLLLPTRKSHIKGNLFDYYGIERIFKIKKLPCLDLVPFSFLGRFGFWMQSLTFAISVFFYCLFFTKKRDVFYSREQISFFPVMYIRPNCYFEMHDYPGPQEKFHSIFLKKIRGIVATNKWKAEKIVERFKIPKEKIIVYPNAVDIKKFDIGLSKKEARKKLDFPQDKKIAMYTGHLFDWKGADTLVLSLKYLANKNTIVYFAGGLSKDRQRIEKLAKESGISEDRFKFFPHQKHEKMPVFLQAADVLVLPNTAKQKISQFYMGGPLKLTEYMASRRPVVASDLRSIRDVVDDLDVLFFEPDNPQALANAIKKVLTDAEFAKKMVKNAREHVEYYSWERRTKKVLAFVDR